MTDLQVSLIILGLVFIAAVVLFNRWQENKYRKQTEKMFGGERQDVLFDEAARQPADARIEPSFSDATPIEPADRFEPPAAVDKAAKAEPPRLATVPAAPLRSPPAGAKATSKTASHEPPIAPSWREPQPLPTSTAEEAPVSEMIPASETIIEAIDVVGVVTLAEPVSGASAEKLLARARAFAKPVHWQGRENRDSKSADADNRQWTDIATGGRYDELRLALQLADRRGPLTDSDIAKFVALVEQIAMELRGKATTEPEQQSAARALDLDNFCADVDVEIGVNLVAGERAMAATKVRALAEAAGMKLDGVGTFLLSDEHGAPLFSLRNSEPRPFVPDILKNITTRGLTLQLDVPRVAEGVAAFDQMVKLARHIALSLGAAVVDDNRAPLTDAGNDAIRGQLAQIHREMAGYGIAAGSPAALRLFS